jgi:hypothetical protein
MRDRAADNGRLLVPAEVARDDLPAARATEVFDQAANIAGGHHRLVVPNGHCLGDRVRLRALDSRVALQILLETSTAARAQETSGLKDVARHGLLRRWHVGMIVRPLHHCRKTWSPVDGEIMVASHPEIEVRPG